MPAQKKKTSTSKVKVKDLKTRKNPKGGAMSLNTAGKMSLGYGSDRSLDAASKHDVASKMSRF